MWWNINCTPFTSSWPVAFNFSGNYMYHHDGTSRNPVFSQTVHSHVSYDYLNKLWLFACRTVTAWFFKFCCKDSEITSFGMDVLRVSTGLCTELTFHSCPNKVTTKKSMFWHNNMVSFQWPNILLLLKRRGSIYVTARGTRSISSPDKVFPVHAKNAYEGVEV
jgi:hypothetical protein